VKNLFLHGWHSVPGGVKPTYLAKHGYEVINPALPDEDFMEAVRIAQSELNKHRPDVIVSSSRGGADEMLAANDADEGHIIRIIHA
jgi:methylmalonyl-CoA mutase cobalamin-binding subunit